MSKRSSDGMGWLAVIAAVFGISKLLEARVQTFNTFSDAQSETVAQGARYPYVVQQWNVPYHVDPIRAPIPGELPPLEDVNSSIRYF